MKTYVKKDFPTHLIRRFLEPGPVVLVSSAHKGETNLMTMGWHMVLEFSPSLIACCISSANHSFDLVRKSRECVIGIPEAHLLDTVVRIGNSTGAETDKFAEFGLTPEKAKLVGAPMVRECFANFECRLFDGGKIARHNLFIWEVVKAHVAVSPKYPKTFHYRGDGVFMLSGPSVSRRRLFNPDML